MHRLRWLCALACCIFATFIAAQNREVNWPTYAGDAQRSGWQKIETRITKSTAKDLQLLWKMKLDVPSRSVRPILPPVIMGRLISYRGFKELAFVGTSADIVYSIDADLGKMFWQKHLEFVSNESQSAATSACPGGLTAMPAMPAPQPGARGAPTGPFISGPASLYVLSSDGRIHRLNTSTGDDVVQPAGVLPPNARAANLNIAENVIYTVTSRNCGDAPDAVWAIDLAGDAPKTASFTFRGTGGMEGVAIGSDGTVYAADSKTLYALSPRDLQLRRSFALSRGNTTIVTSPVVFSYKGQDVLAVAGNDDRIYTVDSGSQRIEQSSVNIGPGSEDGISSISTWEDGDGVRWLLASTWAKGPVTGSIVSFKIEQHENRIAVTPAWVSREINSSVAPVIANGVVFALSSSGRAMLHSLDAATGKELYSSRNLVTAPASPTGLSIANGRVYFGTTDGTLYAFGIYMEH